MGVGVGVGAKEYVFVVMGGGGWWVGVCRGKGLDVEQLWAHTAGALDGERGSADWWGDGVVAACCLLRGGGGRFYCG